MVVLLLAPSFCQSFGTTSPSISSGYGRADALLEDDYQCGLYAPPYPCDLALNRLKQRHPQNQRQGSASPLESSYLYVSPVLPGLV